MNEQERADELARLLQGWRYKFIRGTLFVLVVCMCTVMAAVSVHLATESSSCKDSAGGEE